MLIIARHGRTASNASGLLLGRADPSLDELGVAQAAELARLLAASPPTRIVSSPLARTRETAEALGRPMVVDDRWIELDYGEFDQKPMWDVPPEIWAQWRADPGFVPPGGESLQAMAQRVGEACAELADEARTADILVVTHVSPIKAAVAWALQVGIEVSWRMHVAPASVTRITLTPSGPSLLSFGDVHHLTSLT